MKINVTALFAAIIIFYILLTVLITIKSEYIQKALSDNNINNSSSSSINNSSIYTQNILQFIKNNEPILSLCQFGLIAILALCNILLYVSTTRKDKTTKNNKKIEDNEYWIENDDDSMKYI